MPDNARKNEILGEYYTLLGQDQDRLTIIKALCNKYSVDEADLNKMIEESGGKPPEAQPAHKGQMGEPPPKGTVQSGKSPKSD